MKEKEIISKFNIDINEFTKFLESHNLSHDYGMLGGIIVNDNVIGEYVETFLAEKKAAEEEAAEAKRLEQEAAERKKKAMAEMLITSGFSFDGYTITKYSGYISGDDAISVDRGLAIFGSGIDVKEKLMESLVIIRRNALRELKEAAYNLGCNAVVGVDFDYLTLDPQTANLGGGTTYQPYIFGVTANGNAVIIEKTDSQK